MECDVYFLCVTCVDLDRLVSQGFEESACRDALVSSVVLLHDIVCVCVCNQCISVSALLVFSHSVGCCCDV
jgi:hypothetical protein